MASNSAKSNSLHAANFNNEQSINPIGELRCYIYCEESAFLMLWPMRSPMQAMLYDAGK